MKIFILKDCFKECETLFKFLKHKNCNINLVSNEETINLEKDKSTIICSKIFKKVLGQI